jgi:hypothetical protein
MEEELIERPGLSAIPVGLKALTVFVKVTQVVVP